MNNDLSIICCKLNGTDKKIVDDAIEITNTKYNAIDCFDDMIIQVDHLINIIEDLTYKYDKIKEECEEKQEMLKEYISKEV